MSMWDLFTAFSFSTKHQIALILHRFHGYLVRFYLIARKNWGLGSVSAYDKVFTEPLRVLDNLMILFRVKMAQKPVPGTLDLRWENTLDGTRKAFSYKCNNLPTQCIYCIHFSLLLNLTRNEWLFYLGSNVMNILRTFSFLLKIHFLKITGKKWK